MPSKVADEAEDVWADTSAQLWSAVRFIASEGVAQKSTSDQGKDHAKKPKIVTTMQKQRVLLGAFSSIREIGLLDRQELKLIGTRSHLGAVLGAPSLLGAHLPSASIPGGNPGVIGGKSVSIPGNALGVDLEAQHWRDFDLAVRVRVQLASGANTSYGVGSGTMAPEDLPGKGDLPPNQLSYLANACDAQLAARLQQRALIRSASSFAVMLSDLIRAMEDRIEPLADASDASNC